MQQCKLIIFPNFYCIHNCFLNLFSYQICFFVCIYYSSCMHICIPLYIHITVLYYILASFQKINVNVNVKRTLKKIESKHSIKKKIDFRVFIHSCWHNYSNCTSQSWKKTNLRINNPKIFESSGEKFKITRENCSRGRKICLTRFEIPRVFYFDQVPNSLICSR